jgi:hypothetical protein
LTVEIKDPNNEVYQNSQSRIPFTGREKAPGIQLESARELGVMLISAV